MSRRVHVKSNKKKCLDKCRSFFYKNLANGNHNIIRCFFSFDFKAFKEEFAFSVGVSNFQNFRP